jgi:DNA-binding HxlR family transcriptional regulator
MIVSDASVHNNRPTCPISGFQKLSSGKHKFRILWALRNAALGYGELKREVSYLSEFNVVPRVLTRELRALEAYGLIIRIPLREKPRRVEYRLTDLGAISCRCWKESASGQLSTLHKPHSPSNSELHLNRNS